jgi:hypothetical protein
MANGHGIDKSGINFSEGDVGLTSTMLQHSWRLDTSNDQTSLTVGAPGHDPAAYPKGVAGDLQDGP